VSIQFKSFNHGEECTVVVDGQIDENSDFSKVQVGAASTIFLDLQNVSSLNSMGLKKWLEWVRDIRDGRQLFFRNCPRPVVDQMNILNGFLPMGAIVESFSVPYYCGECSHEENYLATRGKDFLEGTVDKKEGVLLTEKKECPICQAKMEWDIIPQKYFSFLKYRR